MARAEDARPRAIVLVGLPGAGKSTVGALVAQRLGWRFVDLDREIEREAGRSVPEIFAAEGEAGFRAREHLATRRVAGEPALVLAPGGGWMLDPRNREELGDDAVTVFLRVSPGVAHARLGVSGGSRPLLGTVAPLEALQRLAEAREGAYMQAKHVVTVDSMSASEIADTIVALARA